ncbi:MAG: aminotransferase class III-fold pyridoxal phosphate-dependent enzyme [Sphingomonadaceae bacterium]
MNKIDLTENEAQINWLKAHVIGRTFRPMSAQDENKGDMPSIITRGNGVYITDLDGSRMIDCVGGLWCVNAGYGRQEIIRAMEEQLQKLSYNSIFPGSANPPSIALSEMICELAREENITKVFYGSNGSDAVENAFKLARQYWKIQGKAEKYKFISLRGGYHGTHFGGMAANGMDSAFRRSYEPLVPGFISVETFDSYRPLVEGMAPDDQVDLLFKLMEREVAYQSAETIAGLIAEPVQGGGGMHMAPQSYWQRLREFCDRHEILLISDEVVTGFGRTGFMFGARGWNIKPDIMCCGKGISGGYTPLSATLVSERVASAWGKESEHSFVAAGYTHSGNPVSCAAGLAALQIVVDEKLDQNAGEVGAYFHEKLRGLVDRHEAVGDVRGRGLMACLEMVKDKKTKEPFEHGHPFPVEISRFCRRNGVWLRQVDHKFIISPPLTFTKAHVDEVIEVLDAAYTQTPR